MNAALITALVLCLMAIAALAKVCTREPSEQLRRLGEMNDALRKENGRLRLRVQRFTKPYSGTADVPFDDERCGIDPETPVSDSDAGKFQYGGVVPPGVVAIPTDYPETWVPISDGR